MLTASVIKICSEPTVTACPLLAAEILAEAIKCEQMGEKQAQALLFALAWQVLRRVLIFCLTLWHPHHKFASAHTELMYCCRSHIAENNRPAAAVRFQLVLVLYKEGAEGGHDPAVPLSMPLPNLGFLKPVTELP